jgi:hypothetical protein
MVSISLFLGSLIDASQDYVELNITCSVNTLQKKKNRITSFESVLMSQSCLHCAQCRLTCLIKTRLIRARVCVGVAANIFEFLVGDLDEISSLHRFTQKSPQFSGYFLCC